MQDVTPEMIAQIATRLYQGATSASSLPGMGVLAGMSPPVGATPQAYGQLPSLPELPSGYNHNTVSSVAPAFPAGTPVPMGTPIPIHTPISHGTPSPAGTYLPTGVPGHTGAPLPAGAHFLNGGSVPSGASIPSGTPVSTGAAFPTISPYPSTNSGPIASPETTDGLKAFVQRIQATFAVQQPGQCALDDPGLKFIQQAFLAQSTSGSSSRPLDVHAIRREFPALNQFVHGKQLAWLDNAATTQKPQSVIDALSNYYSRDNSNIHRAAHSLAARSTDAFEQARQKVQKFLGASSPKEIVLVRGTTEGINLISNTWGEKFLQPGDEIILSTLEHHANIVPWQMIATEKGAVIRVIPVTDRGEIMLEEYQKLLGPRTKLVALAHASNSLGTILPVGEMTQMAKRHNARVLIDGAQSVSHIPVDVQELGCDFFVFSGHKIFGPMGIGAVYITQDLHDLLPPWQGGGNMIRNVTFEETSYSDAPAKFEAGTPSVADTVGLGAALDYVSRIGLPNISKYEHYLLEYATDKLSQINGIRLIGTAPEKVGVISFVLHNRRTEEVGKLLDLEGIAVRAGHHCAQPSLRRFGVDATVRPSFAFYNTTDEIDRLADAVKRIQRS